jgi:hypothetical protein
MPNATQIHPSELRERGILETDDQYAERMKRLDSRDVMIASFRVKKSVYDDPAA